MAHAASGLAIGNPSASKVRAAVLRAIEGVETTRRDLLRSIGGAEPLREYRKACRALQGAAMLLEPCLSPAHFARAFALATGLTRGLGRCRDADVVRAAVEALAVGKPARTRQALEAVARSCIVQDRKKRVLAAARRAQKKNLRRPFDALLAQVAPRRTDCLALVLARTRLLAGNATRPRALFVDLHLFRLSLKALRYAIASLRPGQDTGDAAVAREAHEVSDLLGRVMDAGLLKQVAERAPPLAARVLAAASRTVRRAALAEFQEGWRSNRWTHLQAVVGKST